MLGYFELLAGIIIDVAVVVVAAVDLESFADLHQRLFLIVFLYIYTNDDHNNNNNNGFFMLQ